MVLSASEEEVVPDALPSSNISLKSTGRDGPNGILSGSFINRLW